MIEKIFMVLNNPVNLVFTLIMLLLTLMELKFKKDFKSTILSIGVLGTFVGIFLGLLDFNTHNLKESISHILEGLKTAFFTSIIGMGLAILLSIVERFKKVEVEEDDKDIILLREISNKLDNIDNRVIVGELESLRLINSDLKNDFFDFKNYFFKSNENFKSFISENFETLNNSLALAIEHLSKGATEEIIKALQKVIEDFNQELQNQFGENFVKLNEAVINLLAWQENYKSYIEDIDKALKLSLEAIENSKKNLEKSVEYQSQLNIIYENLEKIIKTYDFQVEELKRHLKTYQKLSEDSEKFFNNLEEVNKKFIEMSKNIEENSIKATNDITNFIKNTTKDVIDNLELLNKNISLISNHFKEIEQEIPKALNISLESLNKGLASIINKFRNDYETILNDLKKINKS